MKPQELAFWNCVRDQLREICGQAQDKRDRQKYQEKIRLAEIMEISPKTLTGFLNGHQDSIKAVAMEKLWHARPELKQRCHEHLSRKSTIHTAVQLPLFN